MNPELAAVFVDALVESHGFVRLLLCVSLPLWAQFSSNILFEIRQRPDLTSAYVLEVGHHLTGEASSESALSAQGHHSGTHCTGGELKSA